MARNPVGFFLDTLQLALGREGGPEYTDEFARQLAQALEPVDCQATVDDGSRKREFTSNTYVCIPQRHYAVNRSGLTAAARYLGPKNNLLARFIFTLALRARLNRLRPPWAHRPGVHIERTNLTEGEIVFERNLQFQFFDLQRRTVLHLAKPGIGEDSIAWDLDVRQMLASRSPGTHIPPVLERDENNRYFLDELIVGKQLPTLAQYTSSDLYQLLEQLVRMYRDNGGIQWQPLTRYYEHVRSTAMEAFLNHPNLEGCIDWVALDHLQRRLSSACGKGDALEVAVVPLAHGDMLVSNNTVLTDDGHIYILDWGDARPANVFFDAVSMLALDYLAAPQTGFGPLERFLDHRGIFTIVQTAFNNHLGLSFSRAETALYVFLSILELLASRARHATRLSDSSNGQGDEVLAKSFQACCKMLEGLFRVGGLVKHMSPLAA